MNRPLWIASGCTLTTRPLNLLWRLSEPMSSNYAPSLPTGQVGGPDRSTRPAQPRPFAAVPHDLAADLRLKPLDVRLAAVLLRYARAKASCWPGVKALAADVGRCERTVQYSLKRLAAVGWIEFAPDPNPTGRLIVLTWRKPVAPPRCNSRTDEPASKAQAVAPECRTGDKEKPSALGLEGPPPAKQEPERPSTHAELALEYESLGWLAKPPGDPLRALAERSLQRTLERPAGEPGKPRAGGSTPRVESWRSGPT